MNAGPPSGTVLIVDDDPRVRDVVRRALAELGFGVVEAESGEAALEVAGRPDARVDVVLTDVMLPGISGADLASSLARLRPGIPVVIMSGHPASGLGPPLPLPPGAVFLEKPFSLLDLGRRVREALDRGSVGRPGPGPG